MSKAAAQYPTLGSLCKECGKRPVFSEKDKTGKVIIHPYCGRTCSKAAAQRNQQHCNLAGCGKPSAKEYCSDDHAKKAVIRKEVAGCAYCKVWPVNPPHDYCSKDCGRKDAGSKSRAVVVAPLRILRNEDPITQAVGTRFLQSWRSVDGQKPSLRSMYQISVPSKIVKRFEQAIDRAESLGGSTTRATFFGGQCICNLGATSDPRDQQVCNWPSCSICLAIQTGFDKVEFGGDTYGGRYGPGIYAHLNPAYSHGYTVRKAENPYRAIIVCSVVVLDEHAAKRDKGGHVTIDGDGRVYCPQKDLIIPRQLIIYRTD